MAAYLAGIGAFALSKYVDKKFQVLHDVSFLIKARGYLRDMRELPKLPSYTVSDMWYETLGKFPNKEAIVSADTGAVMTFSEVERLSNKIANWALAQGLKPGDCVALDMENRPEYICTWLGLTKIGVKIALINFNIKAKPLVHSVNVSDAVAVIFGTEVGSIVGDVADAFRSQGLKLYSYGPPGSADLSFADASIDAALSSASCKFTRLIRVQWEERTLLLRASH